MSRQLIGKFLPNILYYSITQLFNYTNIIGQKLPNKKEISNVCWSSYPISKFGSPQI